MDTDIAWTRWGDTNPYFGVLSDPRYRRETLDANRDSFFESGERHVAALLAKNGTAFAATGLGRALDFGCGVGRLAIPLARRFRDVVGLDVSLPMLKEAERNAAEAGQDNLRFLKSDDMLSAVGDEYNLVNSYIVFQHIPATRGMRILRNLVCKVARGGVVALHICVSRSGGRLAGARDMLQTRCPGVYRLANLYRGRPSHEPVMEMNIYDFASVAEILSDAGFGPLLVEPEPHGQFLTANIIAVRHQLSGR